MKRQERILKTYQKNHSGDNFNDAEERKIRFGKNQLNKLDRKIKTLHNKSVNMEDAMLSEKNENILLQRKKVSSSVKKHKTRLSELKKNDEFF